MAKEKNTFTPKEIGAALNNAVGASGVPWEGGFPEKRLRNLRAYALALIAPVTDDLESELLRPEEAVFVLASAALIIHARDVQKTDKLPFLDASKNALIDAELAVNAEEGK